MRFPLDFLPMALCGLATIVAVAAIVVVSDVLRRFVLFLIARWERRRNGSRSVDPKTPISLDAAQDPNGAGPAADRPVSRSETLPG